MAAQRLVGILLVMIGVFLLVVQQTGVGAEAIPLLVGVGFMVVYGVTRQYGFLIPAGILTGLGSGIVVASVGGPNGAPVFGLGLGFLAIVVVDRPVRGPTPGYWWPLIPGGILTLVGLGAMPPTRALMGYLVPAALVVVGLWLILNRGLAHSGAGAEQVRDEPPAARESTRTER